MYPLLFTGVNIQNAYMLTSVTVLSSPNSQELSLSARHMDGHGTSFPLVSAEWPGLDVCMFPHYCCSAHDYRKMNYGPAYTVLSLQ